MGLSTMTYREELGTHVATVEQARRDLQDDRVIDRIWQRDHSVWKDDPTEISNRLGWLHTPGMMLKETSAINAFVDEVKNDGLSHALLLGMGGSSLAPEVYRKVFGVQPGYVDLTVLDSTDPGAVSTAADRLDLKRTLFIVSTKSGGTVETLSFFRFFYDRVREAVGAEDAGRHFAAITDPGSSLADLAHAFTFRKTFLNDAEIGGRYSALSFFGLVPAALIGVDITRLLEGAAATARNCDGSHSTVSGDNQAGMLGSAIGELALRGRDKLTLVPADSMSPFGAWAEQLVAESTGKEGKGVLPVDGEPMGEPGSYGPDRVFVSLGIRGEPGPQALASLTSANHPLIQLEVEDRYELGGQFFLWEMATAIAGWRLAINPFDQPNVEAAKTLAREMVDAYASTGSLPTEEPSLREDGMAVFADRPVSSVPEAVETFLSRAHPGGYVAIQAYVHPTEATTAALQELRTQIRDRLHVATTVGYGPRFLHSTGQLHKGDGGSGLFLQLTDDRGPELPIPDADGKHEAALSFGVLKLAQALGDRRALLKANRAVLRIHLDVPMVEAVHILAAGIP